MTELRVLFVFCLRPLSHGLLARFTVPTLVVQQASNPIQKQLVSPITFMPLLHQCTHTAQQQITAARRIHCWVQPLMTFPTVACRAPSGTMKSNYQGGIVQISSSFFSLCSAAKAYRAFSSGGLVLAGNKEPWKEPVVFAAKVYFKCPIKLTIVAPTPNPVQATE